MPERIFSELDADPDAIRDAMRARLSEAVPGADAPDDTLEGALFAAVAEEYTTGVQIVSDVLDTILNEIGVRSGLIQASATPALGTATAVSDGREPYLLPAGSTLNAVAADQQRYTFVTEQDTSFPVGSPVGTPVTVTGIAVRADEEGSGANGLTGPADPDQAYVWLNSMTLEGPTGGGSDGEDDDEFLNRTGTEMQLNSSQVIVPSDFETRLMANQSVGGATVIDLLNPSNPGVQTANAMTGFVADANGDPLPIGVKTALAADIASRREVNFGLFIADYSYTTIALALTVGAYPGYLTDAQQQVAAALAAWLSPLSWSARPEELPPGAWIPSRHVRLSDVIAIAKQCTAVSYVDTSTVKVQGVNADYTLTGLAPLTKPGVITVTAVERVP